MKPRESRLRGDEKLSGRGERGRKLDQHRGCFQVWKISGHRSVRVTHHWQRDDLATRSEFPCNHLELYLTAIPVCYAGKSCSQSHHTVWYSTQGYASLTACKVTWHGSQHIPPCNQAGSGLIQFTWGAQLACCISCRKSFAFITLATCGPGKLLMTRAVGASRLNPSHRQIRDSLNRSHH